MSEVIESEWVLLVRERYDRGQSSDMSYEDEGDLLCLLNAPEQYEVEDKMLKYAKEHKKATMKEMVTYFDSIAPHGLPPCAVDWEEDD